MKERKKRPDEYSERQNKIMEDYLDSVGSGQICRQEVRELVMPDINDLQPGETTRNLGPVMTALYVRKLRQEGKTRNRSSEQRQPIPTPSLSRGPVVPANANPLIKITELAKAMDELAKTMIKTIADFREEYESMVDLDRQLTKIRKAVEETKIKIKL